MRVESHVDEGRELQFSVGVRDAGVMEGSTGRERVRGARGALMEGIRNSGRVGDDVRGDEGGRNGSEKEWVTVGGLVAVRVRGGMMCDPI